MPGVIKDPVFIALAINLKMFKLFRRRKPLPAPQASDFIRTKRGRLIRRDAAYIKDGQVKLSKSPRG